MNKERNSAVWVLWSGDQIFLLSEGPKNHVFGESEKKIFGPSDFDNNWRVYTRVCKQYSDTGIGIFSQSVFEKSPQQVGERFEWRCGCYRDEGVNRSWSSQSEGKDEDHA